MTSQDRFTN